MPGVNKQRQPASLAGFGQMHPLWLVYGHWDLPVTFSESEKAEVVNMGISVAIPAKKILEILFSPALVEARNEAFKRTPK